jgi:hypothetical protein
MAIIHQPRAVGRRSRRASSRGPKLAFAATVVLAGAILVAGLAPGDLTMPAVSVLLFVLAAIFALVAWVRCSTDEYDVTYWDVAGAIALLGICTAALVEPHQLVGLVQGASSNQ